MLVPGQTGLSRSLAPEPSTILDMDCRPSEPPKAESRAEPQGVEQGWAVTAGKHAELPLVVEGRGRTLLTSFLYHKWREGVWRCSAEEQGSKEGLAESVGISRLTE